MFILVILSLNEEMFLQNKVFKPNQVHNSGHEFDELTLVDSSQSKISSY